MAVLGGGERDRLFKGLDLVVLLVTSRSLVLSHSPTFSSPLPLTEGEGRVPPLGGEDGGGLGLSI